MHNKDNPSLYNCMGEGLSLFSHLSLLCPKYLLLGIGKGPCYIRKIKDFDFQHFVGPWIRKKKQ